jgi:hypothetical protein
MVRASNDGACEDRGMPTHAIAVCVEVTPKKAFASALEWPGWCRPGRDADTALEALADYADRYAPVAAIAGVTFPSRRSFDVVERVPGGATTAFGAPEMTAEAERQRVTPAAAARLAGLVTAAWTLFDGVIAESPPVLRKGPRGGGRDRDKMVDHVNGAENSYARKLGVKLNQPALGDIEAIEAQRLAIAAVLGARSDGGPVAPNGWTTRYAARRIAWHVLDHAWEMQDRSQPE